MGTKKITEGDSHYSHLEKMPLKELLLGINSEDTKVATAVEKAIPQIEALSKIIIQKVSSGGRLFYVGSGTSGRLGVVDASECPPTYGVSPNVVIGIIAGGDKAIRFSVEKAEDDRKQCWNDLQHFDISEKDVVIGISASGTTPYVVGGLTFCKENNVLTGCITCNKGSEIASLANFPVEVVVGPEFVTGSTRMKSGTAQKMVLNMLSTSLMIQLGKVKGNKMVDMQLSNDKLFERATKMVQEFSNVSKETAEKILQKKGSVRDAIESLKKV